VACKTFLGDWVNVESWHALVTSEWVCEAVEAVRGTNWACRLACLVVTILAVLAPEIGILILVDGAVLNTLVVTDAEEFDLVERSETLNAYLWR
jgi:hypothetical protein